MCLGAFRFRYEGDCVRSVIGSATRQDHPHSRADEHRPARFPRHRRQPTEEGRRTADAAHGGRSSVRKHHADQKDVPEQNVDGGRGAKHRYVGLLSVHAQSTQRYPAGARCSVRTALDYDQFTEYKQGTSIQSYIRSYIHQIVTNWIPLFVTGWTEGTGRNDERRAEAQDWSVSDLCCRHAAFDSGWDVSYGIGRAAVTHHAAHGRRAADVGLPVSPEHRRRFPRLERRCSLRLYLPSFNHSFTSNHYHSKMLH